MDLKCWMKSCIVEQSEDPPSVPGTYVWNANLSVPIHDFLHFVQAAVVPARELETQRPVRRNERPANQLERYKAMVNTQNIRYVHIYIYIYIYRGVTIHIFILNRSVRGLRFGTHYKPNHLLD